MVSALPSGCLSEKRQPRNNYDAKKIDLGAAGEVYTAPAVSGGGEKDQV